MVFASFMAISHPFSKDHTFCRDLFFYIFTGYFTGKFISHFLSSVLSVTHIIFICFSLFISHTIYVKYSVNRGSPFHIVFTSFSQLFSHTCGKSCEILCENGASVHMLFHGVTPSSDCGRSFILMWS